MPQNDVVKNIWKAGKGLLLSALSYTISAISVSPELQVPVAVILTGLLAGLQNYLKHTEALK